MRLPLVLLPVLFTFSMRAARADEPDDPDDDVPEPLEGLAVSVEGTFARRPESTDAGAMVRLTLPLDRLARRRVGRRAQPIIRPLSAKQPKVDEREPEPEEPKPVPVVVKPDVARAAVRAALVEARLLDGDARVEAIASRARTSALLPELRLRVTRLVDESQSLSPTEADPMRTTASGGASFWLEARATWRLDRLVFADEEVALEKIRDDRAQARAAMTERVLELLFVWQHARAVEADESRSADERLAATLRALEAEAALDVATGGWFSRRRSPRGR